MFIPCHTCYEVGRVVLSINLVQFCVRLLFSFSINKELGPKVVMIRRMITDLMWFFVILLVFVFAYTIASEAILYPNTEVSLKLLYYLPRKAYWQIYGELFLEELEGIDHLNCVQFYTFQQVQENTDIYWHFQRFNLIFEYSARPCLPPPLIIFSYIRMAVVWGYKKACYQDFGEKKNKELVRWEDIMVETYLSEMETITTDSVQEQVKGLAQRLDSMQSKTEGFMDQLEKRSADIVD
nr:hypothetical protein BaRGS_021246 [Batillaria attramentaria]